MPKLEYNCNECGYYFQTVSSDTVSCPVCESLNTEPLLEMLRSKMDPFGSKFGGCGGCSGGSCSSKKDKDGGGGCSCGH